MNTVGEYVINYGLKDGSGVGTYTLSATYTATGTDTVEVSIEETAFFDPTVTHFFRFIS